jgi:serine/threonine-protein kinase
MSSLTHPNTVAVYDFGQSPEGNLYYAMEYLSGITLEDLVQIKGPQPPQRIVYILEQVCGSLNEAHGKDLIHRDIKPANIMLCERGGLFDVVKVLDFGLVKEMRATDVHLTQANILVGTPLYIAPELISAAERASPQSDIYALGAVGYFLLTGQNVFEGSSAVEICAAHLHDQPVPPSERTTQSIPRDLERIVLRCLEKDPSQRPPDAAQLAGLLRACQDYGKWTAVEAHAWWTANRETLPLDDEQQSHPPMSNTQLLIDVDARLELIGQAASNAVASK